MSEQGGACVQEEELQEAFKLFDSDSDGVITPEELKGIITRVGGSISQGEALAILRQADKDQSGGIDYSEFRKLWAIVTGEVEDELEIREEFTRIDLDKNGFITKDEMLAVISNCDHFLGDKLKEATKCIAELDVDEDGRVSYPEFLLCWIYKQ